MSTTAAAAPLPIVFTENVGQWPDEFAAGAIGDAAVTMVGSSGIGALFPDGRLVHVATGARGRVERELPLGPRINWFIGDDPARWRAKVPAYGAMRITEVAPGIDVVLAPREGHVELLLEVAAGVDPAGWHMRVRGADEVRVDGRDLVVEVGKHQMRWSAPVAHQGQGAARVAVPVAFATRGSEVWFELGAHDPERAVVIDPILSYAVAIPGAGQVRGVAVAPSGHAQIAASQFTGLGMLPTTTGVVQPSSVDSDLVLVRVDPAASGAASLVWATYLGGTGTDFANDVAVAPTGEVHVVARPGGADFPMQRAVDATAFGQDGVLSVLSGDGAQLLFSTYLSYHPGAPAIYVTSVATDARGWSYIGGRIDGNWTTTNATPPVGTNGLGQAFLAVYDPVAAAEVVGLSFGGGGTDQVESLAVDSNGHAVAAISATAGFPMTTGVVGPSFDNAVVVKVGPIVVGTPAQLLWSTSLPGSGAEAIARVAVDSSRAVYVTGTTNSQDFVTTPGAWRTTLPAGAVDVFVTKLDPSATTWLYSTLVGGPTRTDGLAVDGLGRAYVVSSGGAWTPTSCGTPQGPLLTVFSPSGATREFATGLGNGMPTPFDVAAGPGGVAFVSGDYGASFTPVGAFGHNNGNGYFLALPTPATCTNLAVSATGPTSGAVGVNLTFDVTVQGGAGGAAGATLVITPSLPATFVSVSNATCTGSSCALGDIPPGGSVIVQVVLRPAQAGNLTTTFAGSSSTYELDPSNDTATRLTVVDPATSPCGAVTYAGECLGRVLRYCADEGTGNARLVSVNCATDIYPPGVSGDCALIDPVYGHDCTVAPGDSCAFPDGEGGTYVSFCRGAAPGCVYTEGTPDPASCAESVGPCSEPAPGQTFTPACSGAVLVRGCQVNQPIGLDCASLGGRCGNAACVELPSGARCDASERLCRAGLLCQRGICVDPATLCDPATFAPRCAGAVLETCDLGTGTRVDVDCAARRATCGAPFTCIDDGSGRCDQLGLACVAPTGSAQCDLTQGVYCGAGQSCVAAYDAVRGAVGVCSALASTCGAGDRHVGCVQDVATFCFGNQGWTAAEPGGFDCATFGSQCVVDAVGEPVCEGPVGARCADPLVDPNTPFRCADGLVCAGAGAGFGRCAPDPGAPDAGSEDAAADAGAGGDAATGDAGAARDAGSSDAGQPAKDGEGCGCRAARPEAGRRSADAPLGALGLLALVVGRRRSRSRPL